MRHSSGRKGAARLAFFRLCPTCPTLPDLLPDLATRVAQGRARPARPFFRAHVCKVSGFIPFSIYIQVGQVGQVGQSQQWCGLQGCPTSEGQVGQVGQAVEAARRAGPPQRPGMRAQRAQKPSSDRGLAFASLHFTKPKGWRGGAV